MGAKGDWPSKFYKIAPLKIIFQRQNIQKVAAYDRIIICPNFIAPVFL